MGIAVSGWPLASAVARRGQFGIVSGTGIAISFLQRLQRGDAGHHLRDALAEFPFPAIAERAMRRFYVEGGRPTDTSIFSCLVPSWPLGADLAELVVLANYAEIFLAKRRGQPGLIGLNLLTKIEIVTLPSLYGGLLAGVDAIFMGAGIPRQIPGVLDALADGQLATLPLSVLGGAAREMRFDPAEFLQATPPKLARPLFFPIVSSETLANILVRKSNGRIDGFVVEDHTAGGHNAPPRRAAGSDVTNSRGEPVWGELDRPSIAAFKKLGLPFYVAGGKADASMLRDLQAQGATGVQVGTPFAFCRESGIMPKFKAAVLQAARRGDVQVLSDGVASPTGFPFKVVQLPGTLSDPAVYATRGRACDFGHLRTAYERPDGTLGWRCPAEREAAYLSKGGLAEDISRRQCLCAALCAAVGMGADGEPCIITAGQSVGEIGRYARQGEDSYSAEDVISQILGQTTAA